MTIHLYILTKKCLLNLKDNELVSDGNLSVIDKTRYKNGKKQTYYFQDQKSKKSRTPHVRGSSAKLKWYWWSSEADVTTCVWQCGGVAGILISTDNYVNFITIFALPLKQIIKMGTAEFQITY